MMRIFTTRKQKKRGGDGCDNEKIPIDIAKTKHPTTTDTRKKKQQNTTNNNKTQNDFRSPEF
jgi:hypothetical protein